MSTALATSETKTSSYDHRQVDSVVEMSLLLPGDWAQRLHDQARREHVTVGHLLRDLIGHALAQKA